MAAFELAEARRPAGNDEALLRWNACARLLDRLERIPGAGLPTAGHGHAADPAADLDTGDDPPA
jgi:hypothetical protein